MYSQTPLDGYLIITDSVLCPQGKKEAITSSLNRKEKYDVTLPW